MATTRYEQVALGQPLKDLLVAQDGLPVIITITDVRMEGAVRVMTVVVTEEPGHDRYKRTCEAPGCGIEFFAESPKAQFHDGACRVRAFRARQKAEAEALIAAANESRS